METNQIKKFAIEARNILKTGVLNKITSLGFDAHGKVEEKNKPLKVQPGAIFMGTHIAMIHFMINGYHFMSVFSKRELKKYAKKLPTLGSIV